MKYLCQVFGYSRGNEKSVYDIKFSMIIDATGAKEAIQKFIASEKFPEFSNEENLTHLSANKIGG